MTWGAAAAKAKFSALLDEAESNGPQLVLRRKQQYLLVTKEQWEQHAAAADQSANDPATAKPFVSAWDALRVPAEFRTDEDLFVRERGGGRIPQF